MTTDYTTAPGKLAFEAGTPGIYTGVPFSKYLACPAVSRSELCIMLDKSPQHYRSRNGGAVRASSEALSRGRALHTLLQEPELFSATFDRGPINPKTGLQYGANTNAWIEAEQEAESRGKCLYSDSWDIDAMVEAVRENPESRRILAGRPLIEATLIWNDPASGVVCKARPDNLQMAAGIMIDIKTTESAHPSKFATSCVNYGYFDQAAHYQNGVKALTGVLVEPWLIPVETEPPHAVACYRIADDSSDDETMLTARMRVAYALGKIAECEKSGKWPGYTGDRVCAPTWWINQSGRFAVREATEGEDPSWL